MTLAAGIPEYVPQGAGMLALVVVGWFVYRVLHRVIGDLQEHVEELQRDNEECKRENRECRWRLGIVVRILDQTQPGAVPDDFWAPPAWGDEAGERPAHRESRRRRGRGA